MNALAIAAAAYLIAQAAFSSYCFRKARKLSRKSYAGKSKHGNSRKTLKILIAGDSLAAGVGASSFGKSLAGRIATTLAKHHTVILTNVAVSGSRMKDLTAAPRQKQDIAIIVASSNDLYHFTSTRQFESDVTKALRLYSKHAKRVILVGPGNIGGATAIPLLLKPFYNIMRPRYAAIMKKASAKCKNTSFANPLDFSIKPYGKTEAEDGFHPNDNGHRYWADIIVKSIVKFK
ncbi:SGNH/GDSL hydrolase family protein [Candidatus Woesearchaeota archaeon]|nr:SGNH/GDSL hydrolase family protein [Candidatus Woesearchaeota archaeon]